MRDPIFRIDELVKHSVGKSVLHFGYVQHSWYEQSIENNTWMHGLVSKVATRVVGIDYLEKEVGLIKAKYGYEGYFGDAMALDNCKLNEKFDVIICGELIEHITNPGLMLEGMKRFMKKDAVLLITTPNVWGREYRSLIAKKKEESWVNAEHVHWYSYFTLANTLERHGYEKLSYDYYFHFNTQEEYFRLKTGLLGKLKRIVRRNRMNKSKREEEIGLFFVAKLKSGA